MLRLLNPVFMTLCALVLAMPIVVICAAALNGGRTMLFPPRDPTLARFVEFFLTEPVWRTAMVNSVVIAVGSATLAVLVAWPLSYRLWRTGSGWSKLLAGLSALPFALPPIVFGVGLGFFWGFVGGLGQIWAGIVSHAALFVALPLVVLSIGLQSVERSHLDAAATMGAAEATTLRTVIFPQMMPYTLSAFFFVLVLSFNEFIVVSLVSSSAYMTVTLQIFSSLRNGFTPTMAVGAITFLAISFLAFSVVACLGDLPRLMGASQLRD